MNLTQRSTLGGLLIISLLLLSVPAVAQNQPVTITLWHIATENDPFRPVLQGAIDAFNAANQDVQFDALAVENEVFKDQLQAAVLSGRPPDVFQTWGGGLLETYVRAGLVREIPELRGQPFVPAAVAPSTFEGRHYAVPANLAGVFLWYNRDLFHQHQVDLPITWDSFLAACRSFRDAGVLPVAIGNRDGWPGSLWMTYLAARLKDTGAVDEATLARAGEHLQAAAAAGCFGDNANNLSYGDAQALLADGRAAMQLQGDWNLGGLRRANADFTNNSLRVLPFPIIDGQRANTVVGGTGQAFAISSSAPPQTAQALIQLLGSEAFGQATAHSGFIPALTGFDNQVNDALVREMAALLHGAPELQLYLDQLLPPRSAQVHLETTRQLLTGTITPSDAAARVWRAAVQEPAIQNVAPTSLKQLGDAQGMLIGAAVLAGPLRNQRQYVEVLTREFNLITPEVAMKMVNLHPSPETYNFADADYIVDFARATGMQVRGHPLVWHNQLPQWVEYGGFSRDELLEILRDYVYTVVGRYRGQVAIWDVVNEAVEEDGSLRQNIWLRTIGPEYIDYAFQWANEADPKAKLFYNDYDSEGLNAKSDAIYRLVADLIARGVPIHGVGLQMHVSLNEPPSVQDVTANIERLGALGLEVHITEMDVQTWDSSLSTEEKLSEQARIYGEMAGLCAAMDICRAFITWGFSDNYTWLTDPAGRSDISLPFDTQYQPKPAYFALVSALANVD